MWPTLVPMQIKHLILKETICVYVHIIMLTKNGTIFMNPPLSLIQSPQATARLAKSIVDSPPHDRMVYGLSRYLVNSNNNKILHLYSYRVIIRNLHTGHKERK